MRKIKGAAEVIKLLGQPLPSPGRHDPYSCRLSLFAVLDEFKVQYGLRNYGQVRASKFSTALGRLCIGYSSKAFLWGVDEGLEV